MGRKNQARIKGRIKIKKDNSGITKTFNPENLIQQAKKGFQLLKDGDDVFEEKSEKLIYCIDLQWFFDWQDYVGLVALWDNEDPKSEKTFGKKKPKDQNGQYVIKKPSSVHIYPTNMPESIYYNVFLDSNFSKNDIRILDENSWRFFKSEYPDLVEIPRAQLMIGDETDIAIELHNVWLGIFDQDTINNYNQSEEQSETHDFYDFNKIQVAKCLKYDRLEDLWIRFYLNKKYGDESKRDQFRYRLWKIDQTLHIQQEMKGKTYRMKGQVFGEYQTKGNKVKHFMSQHYKFIIEVIGQDDSWLLRQNFNKKIGEFCPREYGKYKGICEYCQKEQLLSEQCLCKQNYYCSLECFYQGKKQHYYMCDKAYDSASDDEIDHLYIESNCETGLANLGNTCYMNTGLQCLFATKKIKEFFLNSSFKYQLKEKMEDVFLSKKFAKLLKEIKAKRQPSIKPWAFKIQFQNYFYTFKGFNQHDAEEFVQNMLEIFNDQFKAALKCKECNSEDSNENGENKACCDKNNYVYDDTISKEENDAREFFTNIQKSMYSKLSAQTFLGVYKSTLSCTGCDKSIVSFEQFSTMAVPIAEKKQETTTNIVYVPFDLKEEIKQVKLTLPNDSKTTVQEIIQKVAEQLSLPEENISRMMFAIVTNENVKQEFFDKNCNKKAIDIFKECSFSINKFAVIYQLQHEYEHYTENSKIICINFKKAKSKEGSKIIFGIPRVIVINTQEIVADIYQQIAGLLLNIFPEGSDIISNQISSEESESNDEELQKLWDDLKYEVLINSEKQKRKKGFDECYFCQKTTCKSCPLPFLKDKQYQQFTQDYDKDLSLTLLFINIDQANQLPQKAFNQMDLQKIESSQPTLYDCMKLNQEQEYLDEDNMYDCDVCKTKQIASKEVTIYYAPRYIFIQLKRFKDNKKGEKVKDNIQVNYGEVEDFSDFIYKVNPVIEASLKNIPSKFLYRLYGVIAHAGKINQGHFTCYTYQNERWTHYNDDVYKQVDASEVINNRNAYLVFYELIE